MTRLSDRSLWIPALAALSLWGCSDPGTPAPPADAQFDAQPVPDMATTVVPRDDHVAATVIAALTTLAGAYRDRTWSVSAGNLIDRESRPGAAVDDGAWLLQTPPGAYFGQGYAALPLPAVCSGAGCVADFGLRACATQAECSQGGLCTEVAATVTAPGQAPRKLCTGHSDAIYDEVYRVITSAERVVDVTSLLPPDGRFETAIRNAITFLSQSGKAVQVRLLFGCYPFPGGAVDSRQVLTRLTRDLPANSKVQVYVGNYRSSNAPPSWNHSKIVAADGRLGIVGGHNLWDAHYLGKDPVHDLSMRVRGPAVVAAHLFADAQWRYTCATRSALYCATGSVCSHHFGSGVIDEGCAPALDPKALPSEAAGQSRVISVGRLAYIDPTDMSNQSDLAFSAMIGAARTSIRISQQDLGPPSVPILGIPAGKWPDAMFGQLGVAMARGVDVYLVLSNKDSVAGGLSASDASYSNGYSATDVALHIRDYLEKNPPPGVAAGAVRELLCQRLHVAPLRFSSEDSFPSGVSYPNHAKLVMVDDQAFYLGSQNQYDAGLTEYGMVVDDERAAATLLRDYYAPLWRHSSRKAISGSDAPTCALR